MEIMDNNNVDLTGKISEKIQHTTTANGDDVCNFMLLVTDHEGKQYINVTAYSKPARFAKKLRKGSRIILHGKLRQEKWESKSGKRLSRLIVIAERIERDT